jgi:hypothetical protein
MYGNYKRSLEAQFPPPNLRVQFTTADEKWLPAPSRWRCGIHSCIVKILDKSGIVGQLNEILREDDHFHSRSLNSDGSVDSTALNNNNSILLRFYRKLSRPRYFRPNPSNANIR